MLGNYAVKENKKKDEEEFKRFEGVPHTKYQYTSKIKFEVFTEAFCRSTRQISEIFNHVSSGGARESEFAFKNIEPLCVLHSSKVCRVLLVKNKLNGEKYALKYLYKWKLAPIDEDEAYLKRVYKLANYRNVDNIVNYHSIIESSTLTFFYMKFYIGGSLMYHMRKMKTLSEELCRKILSHLVLAIDQTHTERRILLSELFLILRASAGACLAG